MFLSRATVFTALILLATIPVFSQEPYSTRTIVVEDLIEKMARQSEAELDYQTLFQDIYGYLESPLNLNTATRAELEKLNLLTDFQILSLQDYIRENGALLSIYELPLVYGFDESLARTLEPLVVFESPDRVLPVGKRKSSHQLLMRVSSVLEEQKGYSGLSRYTGNRLRIMTKYRYKLGNKLLIGYNGDKDPGEPFFSGENRQGYDFNSAYLRVNNVWKFKSIMAGDFQVKTGQGLSLWSGLAFGKSADIINIRRRGDALNHYTSVDENRFLRGISATVGLGGFDITGFLSHKRIDANMVEDTIGDERIFSSFQSTGYHRTPGEFADKDAVRETVAGGNIAWQADRLRIGATFVHYFYDADYLRNSQISNPWEFRGNSNTNLGADYTLGLNRVSFFGEFSYSPNTGTGDLQECSAASPCYNGSAAPLHG